MEPSFLRKFWPKLLSRVRSYFRVISNFGLLFHKNLNLFIFQIFSFKCVHNRGMNVPSYQQGYKLSTRVIMINKFSELRLGIVYNALRTIVFIAEGATEICDAQCFQL